MSARDNAVRDGILALAAVQLGDGDHGVAEGAGAHRLLVLVLVRPAAAQSQQPQGQHKLLALHRCRKGQFFLLSTGQKLTELKQIKSTDWSNMKNVVRIKS